jgi:hypothetical protein
LRTFAHLKQPASPPSPENHACKNRPKIENIFNKIAAKREKRVSRHPYYIEACDVARRAAQANTEKLNEKTMPDLATIMYQLAEAQPPSRMIDAPRRHNPPTQPADA